MRDRVGSPPFARRCSCSSGDPHRSRSAGRVPGAEREASVTTRSLCHLQTAGSRVRVLPPATSVCPTWAPDRAAQGLARPARRGRRYLPVPRPGPRRPGSWLPSLPTPGLPHLPRFQSPSRAAQTAPARRRTLGAQPHRVSPNPAIPHPSRRPAHPNGSADLERSKLLRTRSAAFNIPAPPSSATPLSFGELFVPTSCQSSTSSLERPRNRSLIGSPWEPTPRMGGCR